MAALVFQRLPPLVDAWDSDQDLVKPVITQGLADNQLIKVMKARTGLEMIMILNSRIQVQGVSQ
jgi:hypothetical protein